MEQLLLATFLDSAKFLNDPPPWFLRHPGPPGGSGDDPNAFLSPLKYFSLPNNSAANLNNFLKNSILHGLILSYTFIDFGKFLAQTSIFTNEK